MVAYVKDLLPERLKDVRASVENFLPPAYHHRQLPLSGTQHATTYRSVEHFDTGDR
jgi:hypothetical protein